MKKSNLDKMVDKVNKKEKDSKLEIKKLKEVINALIDLIQKRNF